MLSRVAANNATSLISCMFFNEFVQAAQRQLETQGRDALRRAQERSKRFGEESERMSAIAREARLLTEQ